MYKDVLRNVVVTCHDGSIDFDHLVSKDVCCLYLNATERDYMIRALMPTPALLIVSESIWPKEGDIVLVAINGKRTMKIFRTLEDTTPQILAIVTKVLMGLY